MASDSEDKASSEHPHSGNFFLRPPLSGSVPLSASAPGASTMLQKALHRARTTAASFAAGTVAGLNSLSGSPPELWKAYVLKFLDSYAYFSFSLIFTLFLSDEFGMSDVEAGTYYGVWGALVTVFGLFTGEPFVSTSQAREDRYFIGMANTLLDLGLFWVVDICCELDKRIQN